MMILEASGVAFVLVSQTIRALFPKNITISFIFSIIGGILLLWYTSVTGQYWMAFLNIVSTITASIGIYRWSNIKIKDVEGEHVSKRSKR